MKCEVQSPAIDISERFSKDKLRNILIPGFGYGRSATPFDKEKYDCIFCYALIEFEEINEPATSIEGKPIEKFWQIVCKKDK